MKERYQQQMYIPERGVTVLLPPDSDTKDGRVEIMAGDPTLKRRYPNSTHGLEFMESVCFEHRNALLQLAENTSDIIVRSWDQVNSEEPICTLLFGSVARGLVKSTISGDPSNIDLAVIGEITEYERNRLYELIREPRTVYAELFKKEYQLRGEFNIGVTIQNISKVCNGNFSPAINYIASGAFPLHDPAGIWNKIEGEAMREWEKDRDRNKRRRVYVKDPIDRWMAEKKHKSKL